MSTLQIGMFWSDFAGVGGLDRVFSDLVRHLPQAGVQTAGLVEGPANAEMLSQGKVRVFAAAEGGKLKRYLHARRVIAASCRERKVDLVAVHFALYGALALDRIRRPLVMHFHGPWSLEARAEGGSALSIALKRRIEGLVYRRAARVIVLSEAFGTLVQREFGVPADRVRVVPGHVDLDRFSRTETRIEARIRLGLPVDRPILVSIRRLKQRMGLDRLIDAIGQVVRDVPKVLLCIGGTGALRGALESQVRVLGLEQNVRFLGYVPEEDISLLYRAADINVVPTTLLEGFGLVAAEALAAGTPSLVTPVGGLPEVVGPLSRDLIFDTAEASSMADRLISVLRGTLHLPDEDACRHYARTNFSVELAAERTASVYRELLV